MYMHDGNTVVKQATTVFLEPVINSIFLINLSHSMLQKCISFAVSMALLNIPRINEYTQISVHIGLHLKQVTHFIFRNKFERNTFRSNTSECCKIFPGRRSALGMPHFCSLMRCIRIFVTADHRFFFFFFHRRVLFVHKTEALFCTTLLCPITCG